MFVFGQKRNKKNIPPPPSLDTENRTNKNFKPTPFEIRIEKFPFNKATKVKVISYNLDFEKEPIPEPIPVNDSIAIEKAKNRK